MDTSFVLQPFCLDLSHHTVCYSYPKLGTEFTQAHTQSTCHLAASPPQDLLWELPSDKGCQEAFPRAECGNAWQGSSVLQLPKLVVCILHTTCEHNTKREQRGYHKKACENSEAKRCTQGPSILNSYLLYRKTSIQHSLFFWKWFFSLLHMCLHADWQILLQSIN